MYKNDGVTERTERVFNSMFYPNVVLVNILTDKLLEFIVFPLAHLMSGFESVIEKTNKYQSACGNKRHQLSLAYKTANMVFNNAAYF